MYKVPIEMDMEYYSFDTNEQNVDIQTFCSGGCRYNCIYTYSGVDNNKHITRIAHMTQVDILKPWIK